MIYSIKIKYSQRRIIQARSSNLMGCIDNNIFALLHHRGIKHLGGFTTGRHLSRLLNGSKEENRDISTCTTVFVATILDAGSSSEVSREKWALQLRDFSSGAMRLVNGPKVFEGLMAFARSQT